MHQGDGEDDKPLGDGIVHHDKEHSFIVDALLDVVPEPIAEGGLAKEQKDVDGDAEEISNRQSCKHHVYAALFGGELLPRKHFSLCLEQDYADQ